MQADSSLSLPRYRRTDPYDYESDQMSSGFSGQRCVLLSTVPYPPVVRTKIHIGFLRYRFIHNRQEMRAFFSQSEFAQQFIIVHVDTRRLRLISIKVVQWSIDYKLFTHNS